MTIFPLGACQCSACRTSDTPTAEQARGGRAWALSRMAALLEHGDMAGVARLAVYLRVCEAQIAKLDGSAMREDVDRMRAEVTTLRTHLGQHMARGDWHGVMDAAADICEIEAGLRVMGSIS